MANEDTVLEDVMDNLKEAGGRIRTTQSLMRCPASLRYSIASSRTVSSLAMTEV